MTWQSSSLLLRILVRPEEAGSLTLAEWDLLIRQGRSIDMLARLYVKLRDARSCSMQKDKGSLLDQLPEQPIRHLRWAYRLTQSHRIAIRREVEGLEEALAPLQIPVVVLKGAAYSYGDLAPADGRLFSDIDILLPERVLPEAETLLERHGWLSTHLDAYDQQYYRRWMHELPPLMHGQRQTELDVHHAILPKTARVRPSSELLLAEIVPLHPELNLYRLSNPDLVLHSATHLFFDGEMQHGLRDLEDIDGLLRSYCKSDADWLLLLDRSRQLELTYPLYYALSYCTRWFETPVPDHILRSARRLTGSSRMKRSVMSWLFDRGLQPDHVTCRDRWTGFARWVLYVRSHYLKMPLHLLLPHLMYKGFLGPLLQRLRERHKPAAATLDKILEEIRAG